MFSGNKTKTVTLSKSSILSEFHIAEVALSKNPILAEFHIAEVELSRSSTSGSST